jgi:DNA-binding transcriptional regulator YdaS (Cro superfamily)
LRGFADVAESRVGLPAHVPLVERLLEHPSDLLAVVKPTAIARAVAGGKAPGIAAATAVLVAHLAVQVDVDELACPPVVCAAQRDIAPLGISGSWRRKTTCED